MLLCFMGSNAAGKFTARFSGTHNDVLSEALPPASPLSALASDSSPRFHDRHVDQMPSYPCAKLKLDQFFLQWLAEHQDVVSHNHFAPLTRQHEAAIFQPSVQQGRSKDVLSPVSWESGAAM